MPGASNGHKVFRDVRVDYGAVGDGVTDDWTAIQRAVTDGGRCGVNCNATSTKGAVVYFPPGKYAISRPIVQYYYTSFIGHATSRPIIKALPNFKGIALIDTNFYDDEHGGENW